MRVQWGKRYTGRGSVHTYSHKGRVLSFIEGDHDTFAIVLCDTENGYGKGHRFVRVKLSDLAVDPPNYGLGGSPT